MTLRLSHLSRRKVTTMLWNADPDGWFIRFTGDGDEWDDMRRTLKSWHGRHVRWISTYTWDDAKKGAWWIEDTLFRRIYADLFANLRPSMLDVPDEQVQWLYKGRYTGWVGSNPTTYNTSPPPPPRPRIPAHLTSDYALLEIGPTATLQEVKSAYRTQSKIYHPDAGGSHIGFIQLQEAYERVMQWVQFAERIAG